MLIITYFKSSHPWLCGLFALMLKITYKLMIGVKFTPHSHIGHIVLERRYRLSSKHSNVHVYTDASGTKAFYQFPGLFDFLP